MFRAIECTDDELASGCANALNDAACGVGVPQCDLARIADPAPAIAHCETFVQTFCDHAMSCGTPEADCEQSVAAMGIDCSQAFAIDLRYEECLQAIEALACGARLPTICTGVVLVLPPSASDGAS